MVNRAITSRMMPLAIASLWRLNRLHASWRVLRARSWAPTTTVPGPCSGEAGASGAPRVGVAASLALGIADPWIEHRVHDVRDQVEDDDRGDGHHQPRQDLRIVGVVHR